MLKLSLPLVLVSIVASSSACVSTGTYDDLLMRHERTKRDLHEAELVQAQEVEKREVAAKEAARKEKSLQAEIAVLEGKAATAATKHTALEAELHKARNELASTMRDKAGLKDSVLQMEAALEESRLRKESVDRRLGEYRNLLKRFQALIDAGKLKVKIVDGRMVVALASDILFASGSAALSKEGAAAVTEVASLLASIPERSFQVEGHTDNDPIKTAQFPSNWELASGRALTVLKAMVEAGLPAGRVSAASFGAQKPAATNETPEGKAQNRRIEIVVVPDLSSLPGFEELKAASAG